MKIKAGHALRTRMAEHNDLSDTNWDASVVGKPTPASRGLPEAPVLDEATTALLIMAGATACWSMNYWMVQNKAGKRTGVHATAGFEDWMHAMKTLSTDPFRG